MKAHFPSGCTITDVPYDYGKDITLQEIHNTNIDWITPELIISSSPVTVFGSSRFLTASRPEACELTSAKLGCVYVVRRIMPTAAAAFAAKSADKYKTTDGSDIERDKQRKVSQSDWKAKILRGGTRR